MIDRRKLIRLALSNFHGEEPFVELKKSIDLSSERGKGQLVKAVCALANSNPTTSSYLIVGVRDGDQSVCGAEFIDDQKIQPVLARYLHPAPQTLYENVPWPDAQGRQFVGLLKIRPGGKLVQAARTVWKLKAGTHYFRRGTESIEGPPCWFEPRPCHAKDVDEWERDASASLSVVVDGFASFCAQFGTRPEFKHRVYHDQNVVCWSGDWFEDDAQGYLGEVAVQLLPANITLFWSCLKRIRVESDDSSVSITEHILLRWKGERFVVPFERTRFQFCADGRYSKTVTCIAEVPSVPAQQIKELVARCRDFTAKAQAHELVDATVWNEAETLPYELVVGALNGSDDARDALETFLDGYLDGALAECHEDALRILRRVLGGPASEGQE